jgi:hypothetical protein
MTSKDSSKTVDAHHQIKLEYRTRTVASKLTNLNDSVDREEQSIHQKVRSSDGEIVRDVVFDRIDPRLLAPAKLKGILIDSNI